LLLIEYNPEWITHFDAIKGKLSNALIGCCVRIEHVGSTAIPGLSAKPIIDMDIIYNDAAEFEHIKSGLQSVGYYHNGNQGLQGREVFKRNGGGEDEILDTIKHHLYVCRYDCPELHRHILFRDYLQKHDIARKFYSDLKYEVDKEANDDRKVYAAIKEVKAYSFINYIVKLARAEHDGFSKVVPS
jgi:GrpB-like predicted nucleotidyltransferase (UPF0157 family)